MLHGLYHEDRNGQMDDFDTKSIGTTEEEIRAGLRKEYPKLDVGCFISKPFDMNNLVNRIKKELTSGRN